MNLAKIIKNNPEYKSEIETVVTFLRVTHSLDDDKIFDTLDDFYRCFGFRFLKEFNNMLQGFYDNFETFCREFHEDIEPEQKFDGDYIQNMKEFYLFCKKSKSVFVNS